MAAPTLLERKKDYAPAAVEHLLAGARAWRGAFSEGRSLSLGRDTPLKLEIGGEPGAFLIVRGFVFRSTTFRDGRRSILDVLVPGDVAGLESLVVVRRSHDLHTAGSVSGKMLAASRLRGFLGEQATAAWAFALMSEERERMDRVAASIARCDARERLAGFFLDIYERLRRRDLITGPSFNLPLTQEQIGDHLGLTMVHVNRTLRQLREDGLMATGRGGVVLTDVERLRDLVKLGGETDLDRHEPMLANASPVPEADGALQPPC